MKREELREEAYGAMVEYIKQHKYSKKDIEKLLTMFTKVIPCFYLTEDPDTTLPQLNDDLRRVLSEWKDEGELK